MNKKPQVAIIGCSHSDPIMMKDNSDEYHAPIRDNWVLQMAKIFPTIQFHNYSRGGHGHDYQDMCLKYCMINYNYDMIIVQLTGDQRGIVPLGTVDDTVEFFSVEHKQNPFIENYVHYSLNSPKIIYSSSYLTENGRRKWDRTTNLQLPWGTNKRQKMAYKQLEPFWQKHMIGNTWNPWCSKLFAESLKLWLKINPYLYWFQWDRWTSQTSEQEGEYSNIEKTSVNRWCASEFGEDYRDSDNDTYTYNKDDHLNSKGNKYFLNNYILKSPIGDRLQQLKYQLQINLTTGQKKNKKV